MFFTVIFPIILNKYDDIIKPLIETNVPTPSSGKLTTQITLSQTTKSNFEDVL